MTRKIFIFCLQFVNYHIFVATFYLMLMPHQSQMIYLLL